MSAGDDFLDQLHTGGGMEGFGQASMVVCSGPRSSSRICSPSGVPPGSRTLRVSMPALARRLPVNPAALISRFDRFPQK